MRFLLVTLLAMSTGCYNYNSFQNDLIDVTCEWYEECGVLDFVGDTLDECIITAEADLNPDAECYEFNKDAAKECISQMEDIECSLSGALGSIDICSEVCD
jgi:hypothetical protein